MIINVKNGFDNKVVLLRGKLMINFKKSLIEILLLLVIVTIIGYILVIATNSCPWLPSVLLGLSVVYAISRPIT